MGQLARAKTGVGARQLKSWRAKLARLLRPYIARSVATAAVESTTQPRTAATPNKMLDDDASMALLWLVRRARLSA